MRFDTVLVVGLGAIGSSLVAALAKHCPTATVLGWDVSPDAARAAIDSVGILPNNVGYAGKDGEGTTAFESLAERADLIVIATPFAALESVLTRLVDKPQLLQNVLITDTISIKAPVVSTVLRVLGAHAPCFLGGHPIAGSELSGAAAADADRFVNHYVVLTPFADNNEEQLQSLKQWWQTLGAHITECDAEKHDQILALTSHLPHLAAFALTHVLDEISESLHLSAGSLRDTTRIAAANPALWSDISMANRKHLLAALDLYMARLKLCADYLRQQDRDGLYDLFNRARELKRSMESAQAL